MTRHLPPARETQIEALFACPLIYQMAEDLSGHFERTRRHPIALHLAWGALARLYRSANRLDAEFAHPRSWGRIVELYNGGAAANGGRVLRSVWPPLTSNTYRHARDRLVTDGVLDDLSESFTEHSVHLARSTGLLDPAGPGSRTRPDPSRIVFGDGTIVRPMYRPGGNGRRDLDAAEHTRHDGTHWGNNLVTLATRGSGSNSRVILAVGRVVAPGGEAATAVDLVRRLHRHTGDGMAALVYDGALRGVHHNALMTELGIIVINKVHPASRDDEEVRNWRTIALGNWTHRVGRRDCTHTLVCRGGAVHESALGDSGELVLSDPLERAQVRRYPRRTDGTAGWRFVLGVRVPCPRSPFTAWISPHPTPGDQTFGRPDQLRLLPEHDPLFAPLYGMRNDSEGVNAAYKRTLLADRAAVRGWRRQVLDLTSWGILGNSLAGELHSGIEVAPRAASEA